MATLEDVLPVLDKAKLRHGGTSVSACCPAHNDTRSSLSIQVRDGRISPHCYSGCTKEQIFAALKDRGVDLDSGYNNGDYSPFYEPGCDYTGFMPPFTVDAFYQYFDAEGRGLGVRFRGKDPEGHKTFMTVTPHKDESGKIIFKPIGFPHPAPLYGLDLLAASPDKAVLIVEGEKAADAARGMDVCSDLVVVTWPDGVSGVNKTDWMPLAGRDVLIWPDNDDPGRKAAGRICQLLEDGIARSASVISLPRGLPKKFDLGDPIPESLDVGKILSGAVPDRESLSGYILSTFQITEMDIPPREDIVAPFLKASSINMLYAPRGLGKSWCVMIMASCIAKGKPFLGYDVPKKRNVLIIDGEMPSADIKERIEIIGARDAGGFYVLMSEQLHEKGKSLNIQDPNTQQDILDMLDERARNSGRIDLIVFDNLSSLSSGFDENDNSVLDQFLKWLIQLRHMGYAVLIVHHAGKSGDQRGASRREDLMDVVIKLGKIEDDQGGQRHGKTGFRWYFTKHRHKMSGPQELDVTLETGEDGKLTFTYSHSVDRKAYMVTLKFLEQNKPDTQQAIADGLELAKSTITQHMKELREKKYIELKGNQVTALGMANLQKTFPDDYSNNMKSQLD